MKIRTRTVTFFTLWLIGAALDASAQSGTATIRGSVNAVGPDGQPFRIPGVTLQLASTVPGSEPATLFSNEVGEYSFDDLAPGAYTFEASLQGFQTFTRTITLQPGQAAVVEVQLELAGVREEITVTANAGDDLQERQTAPPTEIKPITMQQVPLATEQFQSALPLVPGVVRGPDGLLNVKGARESQSGLRVNSASVVDPVTGQFAFRLPIEAVQSLQVVTSPYAPEYGQVSGGITKIETRAGTNQWNFQLQDLEPRIRRRAGKIRGIESWTPRVAVGGPLAGPKLTLFESVEYQFTKTLVEGLPELEGDTKRESLSAFTQVDWTASSADHVSVAVAVFPQKLGFLGLNTFNPQLVTPNLHQRGYLWTTTERRVLNARSLVESHFSVKELETDVFPNTAGPSMILAPEQNSGSYFNNQRRNSRRYEGLGEYSVTPAAFGGSHFLKIGVGVSHDSFDGDTESRPVVIVRADGSRAQQIDFLGPAALARDKTDLVAFAQDAWQVNDRLTLDYGVRYDRDTVASTHHLAPRLGFSFVPIPGGHTVVRGGAGLFYDKITLNGATFDERPTQIVTRYGLDGRSIVGSSMAERPVIDGGRLRNPESVAWNLEVDRELTRRLILRVGYQQREGRRELMVDPRNDPARGGVLLLGNGGSSRYRELAFTGRYHSGSNQLVVSYVRSASTGNLNDLNSFFANVENPVIRPDERSRLPFDAPNRFLAWGEFDLPRGFGVAPVVEVRDGFPLSVFDENHDFVGERNRAGRFPRFFSLDVQAWKHVTLPWPKKLKARVGLKVFNITNHFNPAGRPEGVQHHEPFQPTRFSGEPRERALWRLLERRQPDVPRQIRDRLLTPL
ncbi:MAG: TonB-dependent receptor [Acidobacteria bacterium]|nr:TonB-dependent receptor [Acidobacteriota bacterium]